MFTLIAITPPEPFEGEAEQICTLLGSGRVDLVDIRKPGNPEAAARLLDECRAYADRIFVHDRRRSCHTLAEVVERKREMDFVSLSPIFDSISKPGYRSRFTPEELREAHRQGIIDSQVYALGGVTFAKIEQVKSLGFGGAMILGDAWNR